MVFRDEGLVWVSMLVSLVQTNLVSKLFSISFMFVIFGCQMNVNMWEVSAGFSNPLFETYGLCLMYLNLTLNELTPKAATAHFHHVHNCCHRRLAHAPCLREDRSPLPKYWHDLSDPA